LKRNNFRLLIDVLMTLSFLMVSLTGFLLWIFERGSIWGLGRYYWKCFHDFSGLVFVFLVLIHFFDHLKWFKAVLGQFFYSKK